jgi:hypothetical protein
MSNRTKRRRSHGVEPCEKYGDKRNGMGSSFRFFEEEIGDSHGVDKKGDEEIEVGLEWFECLLLGNQRISSSGDLEISC